MVARRNRIGAWLAAIGWCWWTAAVPVEATESPRRASRAVTQSQFRVSTPADEGMDAARLAAAYERAAEIPRIYSLLVIRNRALVAEEYFSWPRRTTARPVASVTKSLVGALVGIALEEGHLSSLDQHMIDFFPEFDGPSLDPRKRQITIRHLVEMRAGYPFDSTDDFFDRIAQTTNWLRFIVVEWNLEHAPGTAWNYSNASSHLLAGVLTKATGMSLIDYANRHVFERFGRPMHHWPRDHQGYCIGMGDAHLTPRQLASFGQMVLDGGRWRGLDIVPSSWIRASLVDHSASQYGSRIWPYRNIRYGLLWWQAHVASHEVFFAWGHGGQFITLVRDLDLVVVSTAHNFVGDFSDNSWRTEGAIMELIAAEVIPSAY